MQALDDLDEEIIAYWAAQHRQARELPNRVFVEAAMSAALGRLRCYATARDLLHWHDLSSEATLTLIRSLLPIAPERAVWAVWCAALHLRWIEVTASETTCDGDE